MFGRKSQMSDMELMLEEMTVNTKNKMKELSFSYEKLSQILRKIPPGDWGLDEEEQAQLLGRICMNVCQGCENYGTCYKNKKEILLREISRSAKYLQKQGTSAEISFSDAFKEGCVKEDAFRECLIQSYEILSVHKIWKNKMHYQRKAMASQMEEMSRILFGCSVLLGFDKTGEYEKERKLKKMLRKEKVRMHGLRFYENGAKRQEVYLLAASLKGKYAVDQVADMICKVVKKTMVPALDCPAFIYERNTLLHFEEEQNYRLLFGNAACAKDGNEVSGDVFSYLQLEQGRSVCILADGMGTGPEAREESRYVVELMEQFLEAGFREEETVRLANSMLTFGRERSAYSSFDLFSLHMYSGLLKMIKSGSGATFLVRRNQVEIAASKTPPAGFFWEVEFDVLYKKLYDGDRLILLSDGVLDRIGGENPEDVFAKALPKLCKDSPQGTADAILAWARSLKEEPIQDDMTVMTIYIWKKLHG